MKAPARLSLRGRVPRLSRFLGIALYVVRGGGTPPERTNMKMTKNELRGEMTLLGGAIRRNIRDYLDAHYEGALRMAKRDGHRLASIRLFFKSGKWE